LRQAEDAGEYDYGGGYEAWTGGSSYAFSGSSSTATADEYESPAGEPQGELPHEEVDTEPAAEPAANGTARVPEY
jgi:hypothetical protein